VAGVFIFGYKRSGMAGVEVYKTGRSTSDESFKIRRWSGGGILG